MRAIAMSVWTAWLLAAAPAFGGVIVVDPGGGGAFTELQAAIDAAVDGDVIVVAGGCYRGIVVDKPLSIVGTGTILRTTASCSSVFSGSGVPDACANTACPALEIGAVGGPVSIAGFTIDGRWDAGLDDSNAEATIRCTTGSDLRLYDCVVTGPEGLQPTGIAITSRAAIEAPAASVTLVRSTVTGGEHVTDTDTSDYWLFLVAADGPPAIVAGQVVSLESTVAGGTQGDYVLAPGDPNCPPFWAPGVNPAFGGGGAGIDADRLVAASSSIAGGAGTTITDSCAGFPGSIYNLQPAGADCECDEIVTLANDFTSSGSLHLGGAFALMPAAPGGWLIVGAPMPAATDLGIRGKLFVAPPFAIVPASSFSGIADLRPHFVGREIAVQWLPVAGVLSRPVFEVIQP
jgi:hypothetical protein